jgi:outer membrane protein OmpA-like peptidoglycan-associated protein
VPRPARRALALCCAAVLAALGCAGCISLTTPAKPPSCAWTDQGGAGSPGDTANAASNTVVLIDTSASYWPRKGGSTSLSDDPEEAVGELLRGYGQAGQQLVSLGTFNGSSTTVAWQLDDTPLPTPFGTTTNIMKQREAAAVCLRHVVTQAEQTAPATGGTDVMAALDAAGEKLGSASPGRSQVMLITDGLSNAGCLNFNQVLSVGKSASGVVRTCAGQGGLSRLRGVSLELAGVGLQARAMPLTTSEQSWLVGYWRDLCSALGVAAAQSCVTSPGHGGNRTSDVDRPLDQPISFPGVHPGPDPLPADLLFAFNSSTLTQTARSYLDILIPQIRGRGLSVIQVVGHTDRVGTAAYNLALSLRRAQAVRAYLAEQGFTRIRAQGVGFTQPACRDEHTPAGRPNPACMAKDRRVVIFLGGHK